MIRWQPQQPLDARVARRDEVSGGQQSRGRDEVVPQVLDLFGQHRVAEHEPAVVVENPQRLACPVQAGVDDPA